MPGRRHLGLILSIALSCGVARAATPEESIEHGVRMMQSGQYEAAMREFLDADARAPSAHAGAEIGLAERALGRWADAELHLTEALASVDDAWIQKNRRLLNDSLAAVRSHLGSVIVDGSPRGAEIRLDDVALGTIPLDRPARVVLGSHVLDVGAAGFVSRRESLVVEGGGPRTVTVALQPAAGAAIAHPVAVDIRRHPKQKLEEPERHLVGWVTMVSGIVFGSVGAILYAKGDARLGVAAIAVGGGAVAGAGTGLLVVNFW